MPLSKFLFTCFFVIINIFQAQKIVSIDNQEPRKYYQDLKKNDTSALAYVEQYINICKQKNDMAGLVQAYKDAVMFNISPSLKLQYADSTINAAAKSQNPDLLTSAYLGKGIVYYYNFRKYKLALNQYLIANQYAKKSNDKYLRFKVIYHIGVVKNFLGYYDDAEKHFLDCMSFFENAIGNASYPNEIYNFKKGYFNSLHQLLVLKRYQYDFSKMDSLLELTNKYNFNSQEFPIEHAYFQKCRAILKFYRGHYSKSIIFLEQSESIIKQSQDFAWASVVYFYLGKNYLKLKQNDKAIQAFEKVDSIFNVHHFILPELRPNFEYLINRSKEENNSPKILYYTNQLLKADSIISQDFSYLSSKIHKEYDTLQLEEEKEALQKLGEKRLWINTVTISAVGILLFSLIFYYKKEKRITQKYNDLQHRLKYEEIGLQNQKETNINNRKSLVTDEKFHEISAKLQKFEDNLGFKTQSLTQAKLAKILGTNTNYLSIFINEIKACNFNTYLKQLRIRYITKKINENPHYLNYTVEALAQECGVASRQNFSDAFFEINGIRPKDYIRKRRDELDQMNFNTESNCKVVPKSGS